MDDDDDALRTQLKHDFWGVIKQEKYNDVRAYEILGLLDMVKMELFACLPDMNEPDDDEPWRRSL